MKKKVEIALLKSRVHWWTAHSFDVDELPSAHRPGSQNCALCIALLHTTEGCSKCPVMIKTEAYGCKDTPYSEASAAYRTKDNIAWKHHSRLMAEFLDATYEEQAE